MEQTATRVTMAAGLPPATGPVAWAASQLAGVAPPATAGRPLSVLACRPGTAAWDALRRVTDAPERPEPESFSIAHRPTDPELAGADVVVGGGDDRGLVYGLLELTDRIGHASTPADVHPVSGHHRPHVGVRSLTRLFTSRRLDRGWLHDTTFWDDYLTELATHRFNRFSLGFGLGYDFLIDRRVVDNDLYFLYPFVLDVPGHGVGVAGVDDDERARTLAAIQYVGRAAAARGLQFGLGLWNHAPRLEPDAPTERRAVTPPADHARYCADALAALLVAVPEIDTLTLRVHFEGGVPEPTHRFWQEVVGGLARVGRTVAIDAHAKGIDDRLLAALGSAGSPLTLSTKYWGEHMGLPYHQAAIREKEFAGRRRGLPPPAWAVSDGTTDPATASAAAPSAEADRPSRPSEGGGGGGAEVTRLRSFTRYGYGDFAALDRGHALLHRIWPGTQRVLATPDAVTAAAIGRHAGFAGSAGVEWCDALTFWGKKTSAEIEPADHRELYRDPGLTSDGATGWHKYRPQLRLWGRLSYDPDADPQEWRRWFSARLGAAAADAEAAAAHAGRILPLITTAHAPSVAGNIYWPELDTPIPLLGLSTRQPATSDENGWHPDARFDMEPPYTFGATSPLDPELFASPDDAVDAWLAGRPDGRYGPLDVAAWLTELSDRAQQHCDAAEAAGVVGAEGAGSLADPTALRWLLADARIAAGLGGFFAEKLRAAVAWRRHLRTGAADRLAEATRHYRDARAHWSAAADAAVVYRDDLRFGQQPYQRGHWRDRLAGIDADLAALEAHACTCTDRAIDPGEPERLRVDLDHDVPDRFVPGSPLTIRLAGLPDGVRATLRHRTVDQSRRWQRIAMLSDQTGGATAEIAGDDLPADRSLQYYVLLEQPASDARPAGAGLWPGLDPVHSITQPYHVVHPDPAIRWGRPTGVDHGQPRR